MDQALDAGLELHERAVVGERHDLAADAQADRVAVADRDPRVGLGLLQAERDALGLGVELQHAHAHLVADLEHLARMRDAAPRHVRDVEQAVDAAEIDERTVVGDVLDDALDDEAFLQDLERLLAQRLALGLEQRAARQHDVPAPLVELDDLELVRLADHAVEVAHRAQVDLAAGQERLHALQVHRQAALHAAVDDALDDFRVVVGALQVIPDAQAVGLLLGEDDHAVFVLGLLDENFDLLADLDARDAVVVRELPGGDHAFGLAADVDENVFRIDGEHGAGDDLTFFDERLAALEELGERFSRSQGWGCVVEADISCVVLLSVAFHLFGWFVRRVCPRPSVPPRATSRSPGPRANASEKPPGSSKSAQPLRQRACDS